MAIMKKDVNFVFFILIIATVVAFAGFTAYYQVSFRNINEEYDTKLAELSSVTKDLLEKKAVLLQTNVELNTTKKGREELGVKYNDLKVDRDNLEDERNTFRDNLFATRNELTQTKTQLDTANSQLATAEAEASKWESKYKSCDSERDSCEAGLASCQAT